MPIDAATVAALAEELSEALEGGRIDKVYMPSKHEVHLTGRALSGSFRLLISANPQRARTHLTAISRENPQVPPMFCMLMRKYLVGARFAGLYQPPMERVIQFYWDAADEMGVISRKTLIAEMIGRHANIILVDAEGRIIDCLRRADPEMSPDRPLLPGLFYRDPPARGAAPEAAPPPVFDGSVSEKMDTLYTLRDQEEQLAQKTSALVKSAKNSRDKLIKKTGYLRQELFDAQNREHLREKADLLMANLHNVERGAESVTVEDFYHDCALLTIRLDPAKTPQQNAAAFYKSYTKQKNAEAAVTGQLELAQRDIEYWESVLEQLSRVTCERDIEEIRDELTPRKASQKGKTPKVSQPLRFRSSEGFIFRAGRNNRQNDLLTMRLANRNDIWLHTQKIPGCHVVIETNGTAPGERTLFEAATVAAWYSQAKTSPKVPVDYTSVKYVKKPPGARPGMVIYERFQTLLVEPDEELAKQLLVD